MLKLRGRWAMSTTLVLLSGISAAAQDKEQYWLFRPTPENLLRDLSTDRPDNSESPFTIDAGHLQLETNIFGYSRSRPDVDGVTTRSYDYGRTNFRLGLTNSTELSIVTAPYGVLKTEDPVEGAARQSGSGGVAIRLKMNLWGNDSFDKAGSTSLGLLPFVIVPTGWQNGISPSGTEGGLIIPFAAKLTDKWSLAVNGAFFVARDEMLEPGVRPGTHTEWLSSASFAYEWNEKFSTYYEIVGRFNTQNPLGDIGLVATGITYKLSKNVQLDAGVNIGITRAADRYNPFVGVSARF